VAPRDEPFVQRMFGNECGQLGNQIIVPVLGEVGVDADVHRGQLPLLQPQALPGKPGQAAQCRTPPQRQRRTDPLGRVAVPALELACRAWVTSVSKTCTSTRSGATRSR